MRYIKKDCQIVEAVQWDGTFNGCIEIIKKFPSIQYKIDSFGTNVSSFNIETQSGLEKVIIGDFIVNDGNGFLLYCEEAFNVLYQDHYCDYFDSGTCCFHHSIGEVTPSFCKSSECPKIVAYRLYDKYVEGKTT